MWDSIKKVRDKNKNIKNSLLKLNLRGQKTKMTNTNISFIGWKYYNSIRKKAMEQKFSWSGLLLSLSIAFFIVLACAQGLNLIYQSIEATRSHEKLFPKKLYHLENIKYIDIDKKNNCDEIEDCYSIERIERLENYRLNFC